MKIKISILNVTRLSMSVLVSKQVGQPKSMHADQQPNFIGTITHFVTIMCPNDTIHFWAYALIALLL